MTKKQRPTSLHAAWEAFLDYLEQRNGADLQGINKDAEITAALTYIDDHNEDWDTRSDDPETGWFEEFGRRDDVVAACKQFLEQY
jgi:hypothetical protein